MFGVTTLRNGEGPAGSGTFAQKVNRYGGAVGWRMSSDAGAGVDPEGEAAVAVAVENGLDGPLVGFRRARCGDRDGVAADLDITERESRDLAEALANAISDIARNRCGLDGLHEMPPGISRETTSVVS